MRSYTYRYDDMYIYFDYPVKNLVANQRKGRRKREQHMDFRCSTNSSSWSLGCRERPHGASSDSFPLLIISNCFKQF